MKLKAQIKHVNYYNESNGYGVVLLSIQDEEYRNLIDKGHMVSARLVAVGTFDQMPRVDDEYTFDGDFVRNPKHGIQFQFDSFTHLTPTSFDGIIEYLSSDLFPGVGKSTARKIFDALGNDCLDKIIKDKNVLNGVVKDSLIDVIYDTLSYNHTNNENMLFFINLGVTMEMCHKIIATLGSDAVQLVKENPYILMKRIERIGFIKNDAIALKMGIAPNSEIRLRALLGYILKEVLYTTGNSYINKSDFFGAVNQYLKENSISEETFEKMINILIQENVIYESENHLLFDYELYQKEIKLAHLVTTKLTSNIIKYTKKEIESAFQKTEKAINIELSDLQKTAVKAAFTEPLVIITGGPGTGKTTIVKAILNMYVCLNGDNENVLQSVALLAPTGKASKRLKELTNFQGQTIHKFLGYQGDNYFEYGPYNHVNARLVIVDESSMMDLPLAYQLFSSLNSDCQVIIVGDVDQLPSVGPGQVLKDLIETKEITTIRLNKIHRQAADSKIIQLAHSTNEGLIPEDFLTKYNDRVYIPCDSDSIVSIIKEWVSLAKSKGKDVNKDIQILAPMYRCKGGINELNYEIQQIVNSKTSSTEELHSLGQAFRIGDKVIQLVNRSEKKVMNGDIGIIDSFLYKNGELNGLKVEFDFGVVDYYKEELEDLKLAYCISIHKSQGSEFDIVILPLSRAYLYMFKRKLIYTAITRAKKMLVLVGDANCYQRGIGLIEANRQTILKDLIINNIKNPNSLMDVEESIFGIGEIETTLDSLSPYDFMDEKKQEPSEIDNILGEHEVEI